MKKNLLIFATVFVFLFSSRTLSADDTVSKYIATLTLREKIGQILLIGFQGKHLDAKDISHIKKISPCGIVFYRRNFKDASDIPQLISKIKSISNNEFPMFFAVDQEGWIVHRIEGELYTPPSAPAIGAANSEELAREIGLSVGNALRGLGINVNLAPVLDIPADITNSPMVMRSFGNNLHTVEAMGTSYILGVKESGILSTAKHFPGIGRTQTDTHDKLPHIKWSNTIERENDILPFASAIEVGIDMIMVGHVIAEPGDPIYPVSLSSYWMSGVLRRELGFEGLIIVDNIEMKPIEDRMPIPEAAVKAFKAGADIIMVSHERKNQKAVFNALLGAVNKGDISVERLNQSLRRIMGAKKRIMSYKADSQPNYNLDILSKLVAENSVVDLRLKAIPHDGIINQDKALYVGTNLVMFNAIEKVFRHAEILSTQLLQHKNIKPEMPVKQFIQKFDAVIIDAGYPDAPEIISICNELLLEYVVILNNPLYTYKVIERIQPKRMVIIFENSKTHLYAVAKIIRGIKKAKGRLPYTPGLPANYTYN